MVANLYQAVDKFSLNLRLFHREALIVQITHKPGADYFIDLLPVQGRKGAPDLFICE